MQRFMLLKTKYKLLCIVITLAIISLLGLFSYAYFILNVTGNPINQTISAASGRLSLRFEDNNQIVVNNVLPGYNTLKTFLVENTGTFRTYYSLNLERVSNTFIKDELKISLVCKSYINYGEEDQQESGECDPLASTPLPTTDGILISNVGIGVGITQVYEATIEFIEIDSPQDYNQIASYASNIVIGSSSKAFTLSGRVVDADNIAIAGATVDIDDDTYSGLTDDDGWYEIKGVEPGVHTITITTSGGQELVNETFALYVGANIGVSENNITAPEETTIVPLEIVADNNTILLYKIIEPSDNKTIYQQLIDAEMAYADNSASYTVTSTNGIRFDQNSSSSNGTGLFYTDNPTYLEGDNRIYYYRGAVLNNNILFGGFCWKAIRTTDSGGVKMIYNGLPSGTECNNTTGVGTSLGKGSYAYGYQDNTYIHYMTGTVGATNLSDAQERLTNSKSKDIIDTWYDSNLGPNSAVDYTSWLEDAAYCGDSTSYTDYGTTTLGNGYNQLQTYYGGFRRYSTLKHPSYACQNNNDKYTVSNTNGNGKLTFPIALITMDEASFAGGSQSSNTSFYLFNGESIGTMTPGKYITAATYFLIRETGALVHYDGVLSDQTYRPVITLSSAIKYLSGDGTSANPYTVSK